MKALLLPLILLVLGTGSGIGAGLFLAPPPVEEDTADALHDCPAPDQYAAEPIPAVVDVSEEREYAKLNNQFVIPVVDEGRVEALVVMSLSLEVTVGDRAAVFAAEPKLRDRFLQVMFDHANIGGFSGNFTTGPNMRALRNELLKAAQHVSGERITDVLLIDIVRQDN
jgi:hypothetical protein